MKNIHILPTDKPSRLWVNNLLQGKLELSKEAMPYNTSQNIYITSDEEIKEGDWTLMFDDLGNLFLCDKPQQYLGIEKGHHLNKGLRKIILTTDQDLIKDGVQAIDDEFLQWFVKNPSCEEVDLDTFSLGNKILFNVVFPKEEPKQKKMEFYTKEQLQIAYNCGLSDGKFNNIDYSITDNFAPIEEPKQETLEEVAEKWNEQQTTLEFGKPHNAPNRIKAFIEGAKWEQQRSYSEEEVLNKLTHFAVEIQRQNKKGVFPLRIKEWFERNKNK